MRGRLPAGKCSRPGPEAELVLLSAATRVPAERAARIAALARTSLDWDLVVQLAHSHGVMPLLYRQLSANFADSVPELVLKGLKRDFHLNLLHSRYLTSELVRLVDLFESRSISAIAYKGPTLAQIAYGDIALRQFVDLDILVRRVDFAAAAEILARDRYCQWFDCRSLQTGFFQANKDVFLHPDGLRQVDLHWLLTPRYFPFAPDPAAMWARARRVALGEGAILSLAPQDLMLALCVHAARHGWVALTLACDIAELLRSHDRVDWSATVEEAGRLGSRRMVLLGFHLARELCGAELSERLLSAIGSDASVASLGDRIVHRLFARAAGHDDAFQPWLIPLLTIERTRARIRYCLERALAPTVDDARFLPLPDTLMPLHYLLRPIRLALAQGQRMFAPARRSAEPPP